MNALRGTSRRPRRFVILAAMLAMFLHGAAAGEEPTIVVGSKSFAESELLGEIMAMLIEHNTPIHVEHRRGLGGTMLCFAALRSGAIDLYPEYSGTALVVILKETSVAIRDPEEVARVVRDRFDQQYDLLWLEPFGFDNAYAIAAREELGITKISELAAVQNTARAGFNHEFLGRQDGYPGLAAHYGLKLEHVRGLEHGLAYRAIDAGHIDLMDAYLTDAKLTQYPVVLLEDDKQFFPPYDAAPVLRKQTAEKYPQLVELINRLAGRLDQKKIIELNVLAEVKRYHPTWVAWRFLRDEGLIPASTPEPESGRMSLAKLVPLIVQHLKLTLIATGLATFLGLVLGLAVVRHPRLLAGPVIGAAGMVQTIPSLALLCFMIPVPFLGIGDRAAIAALFLYALLPIIRNTYTGMISVPADLKEAGRGMGMTRWQLMSQLELPLAGKTIMAGVRTTLVINIGTATIAAFIGAGGLGQPIYTGLQLDDVGLILWGAVPAAILALVCDFLMGRFEHWLEPRGLRIGR